MLVTLEGYDDSNVEIPELEIQDIYLDTNNVMGFSFKKAKRSIKKRVKKAVKKVPKSAKLRQLARKAKLNKLTALSKKAALLKQQKQLLEKAKGVAQKAASKKNILKVAQVSTTIGKMGGHVVGGVVGAFYPKAGKAITRLADSASDMSMAVTQMALNKDVQQGAEIVDEWQMEDTIAEAKDYIESPDIASQIFELAAEKTGINLDETMSIAQAKLLNETKDKLQIDAVKKLIPQILSRKSKAGELITSMIQSPYDVPVKKEDVKKFTLAEIEAFNKQQRYSKDGVLDFTSKDSPGDIYYKQGQLQGESNEQIIKTLATKIFSQNPYSQVPLTSWEYVQKILKAYVYSVNKLSKENNKSYFYDGTTEAERQEVFGNLYVKICYLYLKGFTTEAQARAATVDFQLRDQIWIVLSLMRKFAKADSSGEFSKIWKPFEFKTSFADTKFSPVMIAGAAALAFFIFKRK